MPEQYADKWVSECGTVTLYRGDANTILPTLEANSVDAVVTSPPYAMQRAAQYGGIAEAEYPKKTVAWCEAVRPALKPTGSVFLNIREHVRDGQISDYVLRSRLALREAGWIECDELVWVKRNAMPVGDPSRLRRAWERVLWFSPSRRPWSDPYANGVESKRGRWSGNATVWSGKSAAKSDGGVSRATDVIDIPLPGETTGHPAAYPVALARWLVLHGCPESGTVVDPFSGSGTTAVAAIDSGRRFIGCEISLDYWAIAVARISAALADRASQLIPA